MATEERTNVPVHVSMIMDGNGRWGKFPFYTIYVL